MTRYSAQSKSLFLGLAYTPTLCSYLYCHAFQASGDGPRATVVDQHNQHQHGYTYHHPTSIRSPTSSTARSAPYSSSATRQQGRYSHLYLRDGSNIVVDSQHPRHWQPLSPAFQVPALSTTRTCTRLGPCSTVPPRSSYQCPVRATHTSSSGVYSARLTTRSITGSASAILLQCTCPLLLTPRCACSEEKTSGYLRVILRSTPRRI